MSGKSEYVFNLVRNKEKMLDNAPDRIVYCYGEFQEGFTDLQTQVPSLELIHGLGPVLDDDHFFSVPTLLILDDLAQEIADDKRASKLFTQGIHHKKVSVLFITQNLYKQGPAMRDLQLNASYLVLFKNIRDVNQIALLSRQMGLPHLSLAYRKVTSEKYTPIVIDMKPDTPDYLRIRSHVDSNVEPVRVYVAKRTVIPQECLSTFVR